MERCVISTAQIAESLGFKVSSIHRPTRFPIATNITILCSRKAGVSTRVSTAAKTVAKTGRDQIYASLLASQWSQACRQKRESR